LVYYCYLPYEISETMLTRMKKISAKWRYQKAAKMKETHKAASITAGLLFDYAAKCKMIEKGFSHGAKGKPVTNEKNCFMSLSHSGRHVACALEDKPVGVDVQRICTISLRVIGRICSQHELEQLKTLNNNQRAFQLIWTLKEAYFKAADCEEKPIVMKETDFVLPDIRKSLMASGFKARRVEILRMGFTE
jgi:4'-phosphopantetheinyl transferase